MQAIENLHAEDFAVRTRRSTGLVLEGVASGAVVFVAVVLLAAGLLKVISLAPGLDFSLSTSNRGASLIGLGIAEVLLAIGLFSGLARRLWLILGVLFFAGTTVYGLSNLVRGERTCSCFGNHETPILLTLGLSLICESLLLAFGRRWMNLAGSNDAKARGAFPLIVLGTGLCSAVPMVEFLPRGVFDETALEASTDIKELAVDFGRGGHHEIVILVRNNSLSKPEQLIGFRRAGPGFCSVVGDQFPIDIRPGETRQIKMAIEYPTVPDNGESFIRDLIDKGLTDPINLADGLSLEFASSVPNSANTTVSIWVYPNASFRQRFNDIFAERFRVSGW